MPQRTRRLGVAAGRLSGSARARAVTAGAALALLCANNCGFPEYEFHTDGGSGGAPENGGAPPGGEPNGGSPADAGTLDANETNGDGGTAGQAGADAGGASGEAGAPCQYPKPVIYPAHCFDHMLGDGETGLDCGG